MTKKVNLSRQGSVIRGPYISHQERVAMATRLLTSFDHPDGARNYKLVEELEVLVSTATAKLAEVKRKNADAAAYIRQLVDSIQEDEDAAE